MQIKIKEDIQKIIEYSHLFAERMLLEGKEYYPFGVKIKSNGELIPVNYFDKNNQYPESHLIIDYLSKKLYAELKNNTIKAYGITYDVKVQTNDLEKTDAILIDIKHKNSKNIPKYFFPYHWENELVFGESFGMERENK